MDIADILLSSGLVTSAPPALTESSCKLLARVLSPHGHISLFNCRRCLNQPFKLSTNASLSSNIQNNFVNFRMSVFSPVMVENWATLSGVMYALMEMFCLYMIVLIHQNKNKKSAVI